MKPKTKYTVVFAILALFTFNAFSQSFTGTGAVYTGGELDFLAIRSIEEGLNSEVKGSPYTTSEFVSATVMPYNVVLPVRYNEVKDEMEIKHQNQILNLDKKRADYVLNFHVGNKTYMLLETADSKEEKEYLQVLSKNEKVSFYKKEITKFFAAKAAFYATASDSPPEYRKLSDKYYIGKDGQIEKINLKKNTILKIFPEKRKAIKTYIKTNNTQFSNETSVIKLIEYINTLY